MVDGSLTIQGVSSLVSDYDISYFTLSSFGHSFPTGQEKVSISCLRYNILTKLLVSHDLLRSMVTNQIAFDQQDLNSTPAFERATDRRCQGLVSKLETLDTIT